MIEITKGKEIVIIVVLISTAFIVYSAFQIPQKVNNETIREIPTDFTPIDGDKIEITERRVAVVKVPAVDTQGNGVATILKVEAIPGEGRALTNIDQLLFWVDTQYSIQVAKEVARNFTNADLSKTDLIYTIETEASVIEGPSAGAALTIATIAVLQNKSVNPNVSITGTINSDGTVGPVGGVLAKADVAKGVGVNLFLVPKGQGLQTVYKPVKTCERIGAVTYCTVEYQRESVDITDQSGTEIREVANLQEALKYFLQ